MKKWGLYICIVLLFAFGLACVFSPYMAKDIASTRVMLSGKPELYQGAATIEVWLSYIGIFCISLAILMAIMQFKRR